MAEQNMLGKGWKVGMGAATIPSRDDEFYAKYRFDFG